MPSSTEPAAGPGEPYEVMFYALDDRPGWSFDVVDARVPIDAGATYQGTAETVDQALDEIRVAIARLCNVDRSTVVVELLATIPEGLARAIDRLNALGAIDYRGEQRS